MVALKTPLLPGRDFPHLHAVSLEIKRSNEAFAQMCSSNGLFPLFIEMKHLANLILKGC